MRARLLLVLLACAAAEWVEISQTHYRKPLKTVHVSPTTLQHTTSNAPDIAPSPRNQTLKDGWGKGHVYRADLDNDRTFNTRPETQKVNPFLGNSNNSKKPNRIEIRRTTVKPNEIKLKKDLVPKPHRDGHTAPVLASVHRNTNKTPNRVVFLDSDSAHRAHSSEERNRHKFKAKVEPVKKPEQSSSDESVENIRRADILISSEEDCSSAVSSLKFPKERNRHKPKGKVEPVVNPETIRPPKKNNPKRPKPGLKGSENKLTIENVNPTKESDEEYADSIGNVKLVFQKPAANINQASYHNDLQRKKPNRIYLSTLKNTNSADNRDRISSSSKPHSDDSSYSSTESQSSKIDDTFTKSISQSDKNSEIYNEDITERPKVQESSKRPISADPSNAQTNDESNIKHYKDNFKRLDVSTLNEFKDPGFVTKYETFEIENVDDEKYADVTIESESNDSQEPFVGGASEASEPESIEDPSSTVAQKSNEKHNIPQATTPVSDTKPNPMENVVKLIKVVAETISKNTKNSFRSKINYLEKLRDTIMSNIKERIDATWPDDEAPTPAQGSRRARQARGHVEFPSSEGALMTISFLTFAVFLIKLVLQVISTYNNKMMVSPAVFAVSRAASALRRKKDNK